MRQAMVIVPHPDDELLVGGAMLYAFANSNEWNVKVVFATNGDFYQHEAEIRLREALRANEKLGIKREDVIFLGYGDRWNGKHIYNSNGNCISNAGHIQTYALDEHSEYCLKKWGIHHIYNKENFKLDLKTLIQDYYPEVLICVDFDIHPDHRALYLLFLDVIRGVLVSNTNYRPLILTKLAYENVMHGKRDYYKLPHQITENEGNDLLSTPILKWDNRICFNINKECDILRLSKNPLFTAASEYKSQRIRYRMIRAINSDIVYWRIFSENLALNANIIVSSGNEKYINDLKIIDSNDLNEKKCHLDSSVWIPELKDNKKVVRLVWEKEIEISEIVFFENPSPKSDIYKLLVVINDEKKIVITDIKHDGSGNCIKLNEKEKVSYIDLFILNGDKNAGLTEVQVFDNVRDIKSYGLPCKVLEQNRKNNVIEEKNLKKIIITFFDMCYVLLWEVISLIWSSKYVLMRKYPICRKRKILIPVYRVYNIMFNCLKIIEEKFSK